jgi:hypothetical protein
VAGQAGAGSGTAQCLRLLEAVLCRPVEPSGMRQEDVNALFTPLFVELVAKEAAADAGHVRLGLSTAARVMEALCTRFPRVAVAFAAWSGFLERAPGVPGYPRHGMAVEKNTALGVLLSSSELVNDVRDQFSMSESVMLPDLIDIRRPARAAQAELQRCGFEVMRACCRDAASKARVLEWVTLALTLNTTRAMTHFDPNFVASSGFMMNLCAVLMRLAEGIKVMRDVEPAYFACSAQRIFRNPVVDRSRPAWESHAATNAVREAERLDAFLGKKPSPAAFAAAAAAAPAGAAAGDDAHLFYDDAPAVGADGDSQMSDADPELAAALAMSVDVDQVRQRLRSELRRCGVIARHARIPTPPPPPRVFLPRDPFCLYIYSLRMRPQQLPQRGQSRALSSRRASRWPRRARCTSPWLQRCAACRCWRCKPAGSTRRRSRAGRGAT